MVDDEIPEHGDSHASSSHEASSEPTTKRREDLGKHNVHTHFLEDRNCEICQRTKITRAPCRRRIGGAVPRAENFGDLMTADHKFLSEGCESRNNHRYGVVVQEMIFGPCQETLYTAIPLNPESRFTRRETSHSLFHGCTLTFPELHIRIWMSSKRNASVITGISMGHDTCRILGQVSHNLLYWKKNLLKDISGPRRD